MNDDGQAVGELEGTEAAPAEASPPLKLSKGFARLPVERRTEIARRGGFAADASGKAHRWTKESAREASRKGVEARKARKVSEG